VKALILCEGFSDAEALKALARRLGLEEKLEDVAVTDAEGINALRGEVLPALLALIVGKVVSKPKPVAVVVDADRARPEERVGGLAKSLEARGYRVLESRPACSNTWRLWVQRGGEEISLLVAVNGVFQEPFAALQVHELEDHVAYLKLLENRLTREEVLRAGRAKELTTIDDLALIERANPSHVEEAFKHMTCLLQALVAFIQSAGVGEAAALNS